LKRYRNDIELNKIRAGEITGLYHVFDQDPRFATLKAGKEKTIVLKMTYEKLKKLMEEDSTLSFFMLSLISKKLRDLSRYSGLATKKSKKEGKIGSVTMTFFDTKSYDKDFFSTQIEHFNKDKEHKYHIEVKWVQEKLTAQTVIACEGSEIICCFVNDDLDKDVFENLSKFGVKLVAMRCAGSDNVDVKSSKLYDIPIVTVPKYSPNSIAEHALSLVLSLVRHIPIAWSRTRSGNFSLKGLVGFDLGGENPKTIGVFGTGKIGATFVSIMRGIGCKVIMHDKYPNDTLERESEAKYVSLEQLLKESDVISLHAPLTDETKHVINEKAFSQMKKGVIIVNTSRGALIDTKALIEALKNGRVAGAGIDVYEGEKEFFFQDLSDKTIQDDTLTRLTSFHQVILTSHQAFLTQEALESIAANTLKNIKEFLDGKPLTNALGE
jgi:D-lactate dehydrogenase